MKQMKLTCMALAVLMIGSVTSFAQTTGDFRVEDFSTGTISYSNFVWRGYVFTPSREVVATGMFGGAGSRCFQGGAGSGFSGGIWTASQPGTVTFTINEPQRTVTWVDGGDTPYEQYQEFSTNVTLNPGTYYFIGQGYHGDSPASPGCHYNTDELDYGNIEIGSIIIDSWYPQSDDAYIPSGGTAGGTHLTNTTVNVTSLTGNRILVGFRYLTDVTLATLTDSEVNTKAFEVTGTDNIYLTGLLGQSNVPAQTTGLDGAGTDTALFFEISAPNESSFVGSWLYPADDPSATVAGPQSNLDFALEIENWLLTGNPNNTDSPPHETGDIYYVRAVAINEAGRVNGEPISFEIGQMNQWPEIPLAWWSIGILFAGIVGFMGYRQRKRFANV